jgi:hypothetical protein
MKDGGTALVGERPGPRLQVRLLLMGDRVTSPETRINPRKAASCSKKM